MDVERLEWRPYGRARPVLDNLTLHIEPGERVLLAGPSGSGKSTLLRALAGLLLTADAGDLSGEVRIDGAPPGSAAGAVGLVPQDPGSGVVGSTVARDVAFGLENLGMPRAAMAAPVAAALAEVGLEQLAAASPLTLSGGEQQRLALAGALAMSPRVLLLDEPTSMLDPGNAASVRDVVARVVRSRGLTTVVVEHRLGPWLDLVDRLLVLGADGSVVCDGAPDEVLAEQRDELADMGIWVPGVPDPLPLDLGEVFGPSPSHSVSASGSTSPSTSRVSSTSIMSSASSVSSTSTSASVSDSASASDTASASDSAVGLSGRPVAAAVRDLTVRLVSTPLNGADRVTTAVDSVDLQVRAGGSLALVGPSGSGKSTLLEALAGLVAPQSGSVEVAGAAAPHTWASAELARAVAWVPQRAASTIVRRTAREEVLVTATAVGMDPSVAAARADALLDRLGLGALAEADPRHLSGGEQRRLAVAAAVAHQPSLVLADEPTVGQDRGTWAAVVGVLDAVRAAGSAVVVATHDDAVRARADDVAYLTAGRLVAQDQVPCETSGKPGAAPDIRFTEPARVPRRALAARCGPLALLLASLMVLPLPALVVTWRQSLVVLAVEALLGLVALWAPGRGAAPRGRFRRSGTRMVPALTGVVGVAWSTWLLGGHDVETAAGAGLRVLSLVLPSVVLLPYVDPDALGDHLAQRLHLPARPVVAVTAALQRFQTFGALWTQITRARRVRGIGAGRSVAARVREAAATTTSLFVGVLGQAAALALAMDARGFAGAHRRTWAGAAPWRRADSLAVAAGLAIVASAAAARALLPA